MAKTTAAVLDPSTANGHASALGEQEYGVEVEIIGTSPLLMHRYDTESVKRKGSAAKNSKEKKSDDIESYLYRDGKNIGIPGRNFLSCLREAARSIPDPRSPRKSARDLVATGLRVEPFLGSLGRTTYEYIDEQRVVIQRSAVSRSRPAFKEGWKVQFTILVLAPEYIDEAWLQALVTRAGRFQGLLDARNIGYGLFRIASFKRVRLTD
jgi:hypothetical protein